jgi:ABC-type branched-subunit amino acid transport system ATPase component
MTVLPNAIEPVRPGLPPPLDISEGISAAVLDKLAAALRREREQRSLSILLVEQNLEFALGLASQFLLMERGRIVGDVDVADPTAEEQVAQHLAL